MQERKSSPIGLWSSAGMAISLLIIGIGIGWLIGLSVSPVVSIVITSVTGSAAAVVAALGGLESDKHEWRVNPWPLAILIGGLVAGSMVGIQARNSDWLGQNVSHEVEAWIAAGVALPRADIANRLFEQAYPAAGQAGAPAGAATTYRTGTVLYGVGLADACVTLQVKKGEELRRELQVSTVPSLQKLPDLIADTGVLEKLVEEVICAAGE